MRFTRNGLKEIADDGGGALLVDLYPLFDRPGAVQTELTLNTHSTFVWSLFENGIIGFAALILLVLSTAAAAIRSARLDHAREGLGSAALLACWLGLSFNGVVVDTYHYRILWLLAALVWVVASQPTSGGRAIVESSGRDSAPAT